MTFNEATDLLLSQRGVTEGFCQQTRGIEEFNAVRNGGGGWDTGLKRGNEFRVWLCNEKKCVNFTSASLREAAQLALEALGLPVPEEFKPAEVPA